MRALAVTVAALGLLASGCGGHPAAKGPAPCKLDSGQHRAVARALANIRRLRRIQAPIKTYSERGAPNQDVVTGQFLVTSAQPSCR